MVDSPHRLCHRYSAMDYQIPPTSFTLQSLNYAQIIPITAVNVPIIQPRVSFCSSRRLKAEQKIKECK